MRIKTHEIDTQARKLVPIALPREWEFRELTGRDYGTDMEVEIFKEKSSTGQILLLQIKGTEKDFIFKDHLASFDIPTRTLKYSEHFVTPLILCVCPINSATHIFYYLWLQEYIRVVLNYDNEDWRSNITNTRVFLPDENVMPGNEEHLFFISHFPERLYGACEVARILHNIQYELDGEPRSCEYGSIAKELRKILNLPGYLNEQWKYGKSIQEEYLNPAILAAEVISEERIPTYKESKMLPLLKNFPIPGTHSGLLEKDALLKLQLKSQVSHGLNCMSFYYEETNYGLKKSLWKEEHAHNF